MKFHLSPVVPSIRTLRTELRRDLDSTSSADFPRLSRQIWRESVGKRYGASEHLLYPAGRHSMVPLRFWFNSHAARLLLWVAVGAIRLMQWLYRNRIIGQPATERFFRFAKWLERQADLLTTGRW